MSMSTEMTSQQQEAGVRTAVVVREEKPDGFDFTPIRDDFHKLLANVGTRGQACYLQFSKYCDSVENSGFKNRKSEA